MLPCRIGMRLAILAALGGAEDAKMRSGNILAGLEHEVEHPDEGGTVWTRAERVWPEPKKVVSRKVPPIVQDSLQEADLCFSARAFTACAVMCGRAIEGICVQQGMKKKKTFQLGLRALLDSEVIDQRLFAWGEELRKLRNLGAHATGATVEREDAVDVLAFAHAITDYVYVLTAQFNDFMERRPKPRSKT